MSNLPQELRDHIESRGGLGLPRHSDPWTRHLISQGTQAIALQSKRMETIHFKAAGIKLHSGVFNSPSPSAFVYISPQDYPEKIAFIGVSYGLIFNSACLATMMLGRNDMLKDVGSSTAEKAPIPLPYIPSNLADSAFHPIEPVCPIRKAFSAFLLARFVESVFMHEVSHLIRGHVRFIRNQGALNWSEGDEALAQIEPLTKQALEFDADIGAVEESFNYFAVLREKLHSGEIRSPDPVIIEALKSLYALPLQAAKYIFASMYLPLRMFEHVNWERKLQDSKSHPNPPIRMLYLMLTFGAGILNDELFNLDSESAKEIVFQWAYECELNYMALQGMAIAPQGLISAWRSTEANGYIDEIHEELERLEPQLAPYAINPAY
jgi:hypothetical protein